MIFVKNDTLGATSLYLNPIAQTQCGYISLVAPFDLELFDVSADNRC